MTVCFDKLEFLRWLCGDTEEPTDYAAHMRQCPQCQSSVASSLSTLWLAGAYETLLGAENHWKQDDAKRRLLSFVDAVVRGAPQGHDDCIDGQLMAECLADNQPLAPSLVQHIDACPRCDGIWKTLRTLSTGAEAESKALADSPEISPEVSERIFACANSVFKQVFHLANCLSDDEILKLAAGDISSPQVAAHLEQCEDCRAKLVRQQGLLTFVSGFAAFDDAENHDDTDDEGANEKTQSDEIVGPPQDVADEMFERLSAQYVDIVKPPSVCPDMDQIDRLISGETPDDVVFEHLRTCDTCRGTLAKRLSLLWQTAAYEQFTSIADALPEDIADQLKLETTDIYRNLVTPDVCPSTDRLLRYLATSGTNERAKDALAEHVEQCDSCRKLLGRQLALLRLSASQLAFTDSNNKPPPADIAQRIQRAVDLEYVLRITPDAAATDPTCVGTAAEDGMQSTSARTQIKPPVRVRTLRFARNPLFEAAMAASLLLVVGISYLRHDAPPKLPDSDSPRFNLPKRLSGVPDLVALTARLFSERVAVAAELPTSGIEKKLTQRTNVQIEKFQKAEDRGKRKRDVRSKVDDLFSRDVVSGFLTQLSQMWEIGAAIEDLQDLGEENVNDLMVSLEKRVEDFRANRKEGNRKMADGVVKNLEIYVAKKRQLGATFGTDFRRSESEELLKEGFIQFLDEISNLTDPSRIGHHLAVSPVRRGVTADNLSDTMVKTQQSQLVSHDKDKTSSSGMLTLVVLALASIATE